MWPACPVLEKADNAPAYWRRRVARPEDCLRRLGHRVRVRRCRAPGGGVFFTVVRLGR